jgi:hypothetical protein
MMKHFQTLLSIFNSRRYIKEEDANNMRDKIMSATFDFDDFLSNMSMMGDMGRGLHSSTFQLNLSALYGIGGTRRGCVARVKGGVGGILVV